MIDEGYVKFSCDWTKGPILDGIDRLVMARNRLRDENLIGIYEDIGIGYGNVSQRLDGTDKFVISGTATGGIMTAGPEIFCIVDDWDLASYKVWCTGPVAASSESMTHAMIYKVLPAVDFVVHIHHAGLWRHQLKTGPATQEGIAYGTPEMALEMERMLKDHSPETIKILAMSGHEEGILAFGGGLEAIVDKIIGNSKGLE